MAKNLIERWVEESVGLIPVGSRKMNSKEVEKWKKRKQADNSSKSKKPKKRG